MTSSQPHPAAEHCVRATYPPTVLLVEDDDTLRVVLARSLRRQGFRVWAAAAGGEAVELYRSLGGRIDIALLDVNMPGMRGPDVFAALRAIAPSVRCWFMTADARPETRAALLACGGLGVLTKPFASPAAVGETLRSHIDRPDGGRGVDEEGTGGRSAARTREAGE